MKETGETKPMRNPPPLPSALAVLSATASAALLTLPLALTIGAQLPAMAYLGLIGAGAAALLSAWHEGAGPRAAELDGGARRACLRVCP